MNLDQIEKYEKISKNFLELSLDDVELDVNINASNDEVVNCNEKINYNRNNKYVSTEYNYELKDGTKTKVRTVFYKNKIYIESETFYNFNEDGYSKRVTSSCFRQTDDDILTLSGEVNDILILNDGSTKFNIKSKNTKKYNCYQGDFDFLSGTDSLELIMKDSVITENRLESNHPIVYMNKFNDAVRYYLSIAREDEEHLKNDEFLDNYCKSINFDKLKDTALVQIDYKRIDGSNTKTDCVISPNDVCLKNKVFYDYYIDEVIDYKERFIELEFKTDEFDVTFDKHITDKTYYRNGQDKTTYEENNEKIFNHYLSDIDLRTDYSNLYYLDNSEKNNVIIPKERQKVLIK